MKPIYKIYIASLLLSLGAVKSRAQLVLSSPNTTGTYTNGVSITLKPGFTSLAPFRAYITGILPPVALGSSPSANQNYIRTQTYLSATVSATPQTSEVMEDISYFDGLGRALQTVGTKASPTYKDIMGHQSYDAFGREDRSYLPYASGTAPSGSYKGSAVTEQAAFYTTPPDGVVKIPAAGTFSRPVYEASPLSRVLEQGFPGAAWQPGTRGANTGRTVVTEYTTNNAVAITDLVNTRLARLYTVTYDAAGRPKLNLSGTYGVNQLYVTVTKDENWAGGSGSFASRLNTVEEYRDKQGKVVLKRTFNGTNEILSTYYVYDDFGNLCFVLTPGVNADSVRPTEAELKAFCYMYQYDGRNRMKRRHLPGQRAWESFNYNMMDQLIIHETSKDSTETYNGQTGRFHHFYKYDALGRVITTGIERGRTGTQEEIEGYIKEPGRAGTQWEQRSTAAGNLHGYTNVSIPSATASFDVLEVNYYDRYDGIGLPANLDKTTVAGISKMTQGLPVAKKTKVLGSNDVYLWTVYYYDDRGDNIRTLSQHYKGGAYNLNNYDDVINEYTFTHQLKKSVRNHYAGTTAIAVTVTTEYTYDHRDRLIDTWKTVTGGTRTLVARNEYNEVGKLKKKNLHSVNQGGSYGQSITYTYNERGWLRTANAPLFNQELQYNTGAAKYYNGNIAYQVFTRKYSASATASGTYSYTYDGLNRLTTGMMAKGAGREWLAYDKLGNIQKLYRWNGKGEKADSLRYVYAGGKLSQVIDDYTAAPAFNPHLAGTTAYTYDANGNMLTRVNSTNTANNITATVYNYFDLPQSVTAGGTAISYVYDGSGRKLRSTNGINGQTRDYIDGIEYSGTALELIHMEEGRILKSGTTYSYEYILKDHLGNARSGFAGGTTAATVPTFGTDYYPFGLQYVPDPPTAIAGSPKNNYLYNGKELQDKLKQYDYGARFYDPVIGRWGSVDPLAEVGRRWTPYNYGWNNPISNIDPDGMLAGPPDIIYKNRQSGEEIARIKTPGKDVTVYTDATSFGDVGTGASISQGKASTPQETAQRLADYRARELTKDVNYQDISNPTTSLAIAKNVVNFTGGEIAGAKLAGGFGKLIAAFKGTRAAPDGSVYSAAFETTLSSNLYPGKGYYSHFKAANTALSDAIASDATFARSMSELGVSVPRSETGSILGKSPSGWVWHHDVGAGVMQLVPKDQHTTGSIFWNTMHPNGVGGMSLWGR